MKSKKTAITHVSKQKKELVGNLTNLLKNKRTVLIASIKNLPASQFQAIGKKLRGKAIVKVPKKNLILRAIDDTHEEELKKLKAQVGDSVAILFSDLEAYDLALELIKKKTPAKAKPGQEAPEDIEIQAGPTDLPPGPAISELGSVGLQVQITDGKIHIRESRVIVKQGHVITQNVADIMAKLDIKPFSIGFVPLSAYDTKEKKLYLHIEIDTEKTLAKLKESYSKALGFAMNIGYVCDGTVKLLIAKAGRQEIAIEKLIQTQSDTTDGGNN
jgi:large subunit ribosomal protein L10